MKEVKVVKLSGVRVGMATSWKEAEAIVARVLRSRGVRPLNWDGDTTIETPTSLMFFMVPR